MKVNVEEFKKFIKKATLNYSIDSVCIEITADEIKSKMIKKSRDAIVVMSIKNTIFTDVKEPVKFHFIEPNTTILPHLNLVDEEDVDIILRDEKIIIKNGKQKSNIFFCYPETVSIFGGSEPKDQFSPFLSIPIDEEFNKVLSKIKKVGNSFGKIYFSVKSGQFRIEATDKTNKFSNGINFDLQEIEFDDCDICFDFSNFINMTSVLDSEEKYNMDFYYVHEKGLGMLSCNLSDSDNIENYYLMSKSE